MALPAPGELREHSLGLGEEGSLRTGTTSASCTRFTFSPGLIPEGSVQRASSSLLPDCTAFGYETGAMFLHAAGTGGDTYWLQ